MNRKIGSALVAAAIAVGGTAAGVTIATQSAAGAARTTAGQHIVMQATGQLSTVGKGLFDLKLRSAVSGGGQIGARIAVSSITISQFGGSQAIEVAILAKSCDGANGLGGLEDVVVPQDDTVHLSYPSAVRMPMVANPPASYCLYAETVRDNGRLDVTVVATTI
jgi:hypothetical protein